MQQLLDIIRLRQYAHAYALVNRTETDNEALLKAGLTQDAIDLVMDHIERSIHDGR